MSFWLVMRTSTGDERPFRFSKQRVVIGRETTSDLHVPMPTVAPRHCAITDEEGALRLTDLGSPGGTLHNGNRVGEALLADADEVTVGSVTFEVRLRLPGRVDL